MDSFYIDSVEQLSQLLEVIVASRSLGAWFLIEAFGNS
jgi:hypothetical protein